MITLCMDTSHIYLVLALYREEELLGSVQKECWKKQSEEIFPCLETLLADAGLKPEDIDQVVITSGPGSYTGVRIAMTIAKVMCSLRSIPLYTVPSLDLFAGNETCTVVLDARSHRAYTAVYEAGKRISGPEALPTDEIMAGLKADETVIGDGHLVGRKDNIPDLAMRFMEIRGQWVKAENPDLVTPEYLKSIEAYRAK